MTLATQYLLVLMLYRRGTDAVPSGWCRTSNVGPAAPPAPVGISLKPKLAVKHCLDDAMWSWTAARLRNRSMLLELTGTHAAAPLPRVTPIRPG